MVSAYATGNYPNKAHYSVMPLYHSSGSQIGTGPSLVDGTKTVIRTKFSASNFFKDCSKYKTTVSTILKLKL